MVNNKELVTTDTHKMGLLCSKQTYSLSLDSLDKDAIHHGDDGLRELGHAESLDRGDSESSMSFHIQATKPNRHFGKSDSCCSGSFRSAICYPRMALGTRCSFCSRSHRCYRIHRCSMKPPVLRTLFSNSAFPVSRSLYCHPITIM